MDDMPVITDAYENHDWPTIHHWLTSQPDLDHAVTRLTRHLFAWRHGIQDWDPRILAMLDDDTINAAYDAINQNATPSELINRIKETWTDTMMNAIILSGILGQPLATTPPPAFIPTPMYDTHPPFQAPENASIWSPYWTPQAVNLTHRDGQAVQSLTVMHVKDGDPTGRDADIIARRLITDPKRIPIEGTRGIRYHGTSRTPLERYRQGDMPFDTASDQTAN